MLPAQGNHLSPQVASQGNHPSIAPRPPALLAPRYSPSSAARAIISSPRGVIGGFASGPRTSR